MKICVLSVVFWMLLSYSAVWAVTIETPDIGKNTFIDLQLFKFPIKADPHSNVVSEKKGETKYDGGKEEEMLDKKVDDAIKKALEEK
ncbi:MAG: hypothetical protein WB930_14355 [Syntrophobacteraceae bacterium]